MKTPPDIEPVKKSLLAQFEHGQRAEAICRDLTRAEVNQIIVLLGKCTEVSVLDIRHAIAERRRPSAGA